MFVLVKGVKCGQVLSIASHTAAIVKPCLTSLFRIMAAAVLESRPVGALACQKDSYLRSLETEVVSCVKLFITQTNKKVKGPKVGENDVSSKDAYSGLWQVEFKDSVLFPEGKSGISVIMASRSSIVC